VPRRKLQAREIDTLPAINGRRTEYWDALVPGLVLRVAPSGRRAWCVWRRTPAGRVERTTLAHVYGLDDARARAREILSGQAAAAALAAPVPLADLVEAYVEARSPHLAPASVEVYDYAQRLVAASPLATANARTLDTGATNAYLRALAAATPVSANRLYETLRATLRWAYRQGQLEVDPSPRLDRPATVRPRERVLDDGELQVLLGLLQPGPVSVLVRVLLLTGQRRGETLAMRWDDLDEQAGAWRIPGPTRKGGRTHLVPLVADALDALRPLRKLPGDGPFTSLSPTNPGRWWMPISREAQAAGLAHFTLHDLRRSCATGLARTGAHREVISRILGHHLGGPASTAVYDLYDRLPEQRAALERWAERLRGLSQK
jgi:integrase